MADPESFLADTYPEFRVGATGSPTLGVSDRFRDTLSKFLELRLAHSGVIFEALVVALCRKTSGAES